MAVTLKKCRHNLRVKVLDPGLPGKTSFPLLSQRGLGKKVQSGPEF